MSEERGACHCEGLQKQLGNLTDIRLRDLISDDDFTKRREDLKNQLTKSKESLSQFHNRSKNWLDTIDRAFNFAAHAREAFIKGDIQTKREILTALGKNFVLKNGQLAIEPMDWLVPISNLKLDEQKCTERLELPEFGLNKGKNSTFDAVLTQWGGYWELNPG